jgi:hypothetical protein
MKLVLLTALLASAASQPAVQTPGEIVVTGRRLADTEAALKACLDRKCPVNEDIDASLAHAENQMMAGRYEEARRTVLGSLSRNGRQAKKFPEPVSDLYRADALLANHLGLDRDYRASTIAILQALKEGIPKPDHRHFGARMEIAAMTGRLDDYEAAERVYRDLAADARKAGRPDIAALAEVRAILAEMKSSSQSRRYAAPEDIKARLARFARAQEPSGRAAAQTAAAVLARIALAEGKQAEAAAWLQSLPGGGSSALPALIYSPPYTLGQKESVGLYDGDLRNPMAGNVLKRASGNFDDQWIDVGFWVQPDGRVSDVEILRKDGRTGWADPLLRSIAGRVYAKPAGGAPVYRMERYTYTAGYESRTGSRIAQRSPKARVEYVDLSQPPKGANQAPREREEAPPLRR